MATEAAVSARVDAARAEQPPPRSSWRAEVLTRAAQLRLELNLPDASTEMGLRRDIEALITLAETTARAGRRRVRDWGTGAQILLAWSSLRSAEVALLSVVPPEVVVGRIRDVEAAARKHLAEDDPRVRALERWLACWEKDRADCGDAATVTKNDRRFLASVQQAAHRASDAAHGNIRSFRNVLVAATALLSAAILGVAVLAWFRPDVVPLCADGVGQTTALLCPPGTDRPDFWGVAQVIVFGALGGALAGVVSVARHRGARDPFQLPEVQALLKVPAGAATALLGMLLVQNSVVTGVPPQSGGKVAAFAVLLGYAQQLGTRFVDRQAGEVLAPARSSNDPLNQVAAGA